MPDQTAYVEVLARLLCAADVHVNDGDHPTWQQLSTTPGRGQDEYRKAARWLAARLTVTGQPSTAPAVQAPAADRDALRDRIADVLAAADGWKWAPGFKEQSPTWQGFLRQADAVMAVLPAPTDRAAVYRELADQQTQLAVADDLARRRNMAAARRQLVKELRRLADEAQPTEHLCKPGASTYHCPTSGQTESDCHGGFDTCCDRPDLHQPADEAQQDEALCQCGHGNAHHGVEYGTPRCRLCPERGEWKWDHAFTSAAEARPPVHAVPLPGSNGISSCCGRPPCEFVGERLTQDPGKVTCPGPAAVPQDEAQP